ncbi:MAG: hypothetical protein JRI58_10040 [Deltaproteobacteria bacterium]|nr:hypothetical protein [Deltaproteobacteria bacterium]MBW2020156.1 hypothetical protein [Deltaproteobacteria bacterium]MBW2075071.1 hypothetical protein [Deltaproteobacteria bacterium]
MSKTEMARGTISNYGYTYDQVGSLRVVADASGNVVKRVNNDSKVETALKFQ